MPCPDGARRSAWDATDEPPDQAKDHRRRSTEAASVKPKHRRVDRDFVEPGKADARRKVAPGQAGGRARRSAMPPTRECMRRRAANRRQQQALGQGLTNQPAASGTEREADRHLPLPRVSAREQKVGHIHARDQQDECPRPRSERAAAVSPAPPRDPRAGRRRSGSRQQRERRIICAAAARAR